MERRKTKSDKKSEVVDTKAKKKVPSNVENVKMSSFDSRNAALEGDARFSGVLSNPIFRSVPKNEKKISIDKRFESMFHDKGSFKLKYKVDKRGKPINTTTDENLRKYYNLEDDEDDEKEEGDAAVEVKSESGQSSDEEEEVASESEDEEDDKEEDLMKDKGVLPRASTSTTTTKLPDAVKKILHSNKVDYARGEGAFVSEESSDDDETSEEEGAGSEEVDHEWGELDKDAPRTEESTNRLALCNMDWDRIKSSDLMVLFSSFLPPGGVLSKVSIYPSEFGKQRMKEEDLQGPAEFQQFKREYKSDEEIEEKDAENDGDSDNNDEGSEYHREKMRKYQLNRLRYYYAVLEFNSPAAAEKVYGECDGMEYESSAAKIDLRFIPEDTEFNEDDTKDSCDSVPEAAKYRPKFFTTTALQQVKVACTWDETDPTRKDIISRVLDPKDKVEDEDLRAYLASSSSEEEVDEDGGDNDKGGTEAEKNTSSADPIAKYRMLLDSINKKEESKKKDVELEITWGVGLKQKAEELVKKKSKEDEIKKMTPWEERLVKQKEKRRQKKSGGINKQTNKNSDESGDDDDDSEDEDQPFSDDDVDVDMNDPFFKQELDARSSGGGKNKKKKNNKNTRLEKNGGDEEEEEKSKAELDLLLLDENETDGKKHFNFKKIIESEVETKSKRKRKLYKRKKKLAEQGGGDSSQQQNDDGFEVDVKDGRFSALFSSHHYNIDPSEPNFKRTKGMETIIQAKQKQRIHDSEDQQPASSTTTTSTLSETKTRKNRAELAYLVNSIKNKTQNVNNKKQQKVGSRR